MSAPSPPTPGSYLAAAERMLTQVISGARGTWPRATAWLLRLALESALTQFWEAACPPVARCRSHRAQFLLLPQYLDPPTARRAHHIWAVLSRAGHHHSYELGLTGTELRLLSDDTASVVDAITAATHAFRETVAQG